MRHYPKEIVWKRTISYFFAIFKGHKNIRTTQIYANITHSHISGEMERLSKRINSLCPDWTPSGMPNESERLY